MNCPFCQTNISNKIYKRLQKSPDRDTYTCSDCAAYFTVAAGTEEVLSYLFRAQLGESNFGLEFDKVKNIFKLYDLENYSGRDYLLELDFLPNVTPQNVQSKLPTMITFR